MSVAKHTYELTYIINAVISDDQIKNLVKRVSTNISESGGEILEVEEWGSRRLAYPIQKKRNGYYVNMYFRAAGSMIMRLERALEIDDNILRYLTLRMDAKMIRHYESKKSVIPEGFDKEKERSSDRKAVKVTPIPLAAPAKGTELDVVKPKDVPKDAEEKKEETPDEGEQQHESTSEETAEQIVADAEGSPEASGEEDLPGEDADSEATSAETEKAQPDDAEGAGEERDIPVEASEEPAVPVEASDEPDEAAETGEEPEKAEA